MDAAETVQGVDERQGGAIAEGARTGEREIGSGGMVGDGAEENQEASGGEPAEEGAKAPSIPPALLGRLAHDIRSPLGLVAGALDELKEDLAEQLDPGHLRMIELAERGVHRLRRMAKLLSTAAEVEGGDLRLDRQEIDLASAVDSAIALLDRTDPRRTVTVERKVPSGTMVRADPVRLEEALAELIGQARRNARSVVEINFDDQDERLILHVEDDGDGYPKSQRDKAFDRLYEPADRRGTGLGLSIARDLLRAHGGDVCIEDAHITPGRPGTIGGCFAITLTR